MEEPRANHLAIDGGQVKEDQHIASYKSIPEAEKEFRSSKPNLSKSKEKVSSDGAEEKLLQKEDEAKVATRVDMADAKYVVGDHRNGDAKIELDANKRQFSGLTKEELLKYADDPFWVRLRWSMFVLFWGLWLCMLVGAIVIIARAPKCAPPAPKTWYQRGPLVDASPEMYTELEDKLPLLGDYKVQGVFASVGDDSYAILDDETPLEQFKEFIKKAKKYSIRVIVELTANFVPLNHSWFNLSETRTGDYADYFVWAKKLGYDDKDDPIKPNQWLKQGSTVNESAWSWSERREEFYLHQFDAARPDLNFSNPAVVAHFDNVLKMWMHAGADGVRLHKARQLFVNSALTNEEFAKPGEPGHDPGAGHGQYGFWRHRNTADQPQLAPLLAHWAHIVDQATEPAGAGETVFTLAEEVRPELYRLKSNVSLRPPSAAPVQLDRDALAVRRELHALLSDFSWPALHLTAAPEQSAEVAAFSLLLPAAPLFSMDQLATYNASESSVSLSHAIPLRHDASILHGEMVLAEANTTSGDTLLTCTRWKPGHTGYVAVFNRLDEDVNVHLGTLSHVPDTLTVYHASQRVRSHANFTTTVSSDSVLLPGKSTVVFSYVPDMASEK